MSSIHTSEARLEGGGRSTGEYSVPGDKSVSHRAAILAALAGGRTEIEGFADNLDCAATLACIAALGAVVTRDGDLVVVDSSQGLCDPVAPLDAKNSGTTTRLLAGAVAGRPVVATITGDASLRSRPMERVAVPLRRMGAEVATTDGRPPLTVAGRTRLSPIVWEPDPPSAQVKSAVLLAGLAAEGETHVLERVRTRDHTERMLPSFGVEAGSDARGAWVRGPARLTPARLRVPGDVSSAAFLVALGLLCKGSDLVVRGVGLNPTRTRVLDIFDDLGAGLEVVPSDASGGEPIGDLRIRYRERLGRADGRLIELGPDTVAEIIDEVPVLAAVATQTAGGIRFTGAGELRRKESDRIAALADGLGRMGAEVVEEADALTVRGPCRLRGARVFSWGDHRIAMALACAAMAAEGVTTIAGADAAAVSFPAFFDCFPAGSVLSGEVSRG
jgi:3-phosphoshikimate 1-carboxyvinyltransferase